MKKNDILTLSIVACLFRFPIAALFFGFNPRLLILLPFIFSFLFWFPSFVSGEFLNFLTKSGKVMFFSYIISILGFISFFIVDYGKAIEFLPPLLFSTVIVSGFFFFVLPSTQDENEVFSMMDSISNYVIWFGGAFFLVSDLVLVNDYPSYGINYIAPELVSNFLLYKEEGHLSQRVVGFLIGLEASGLSVLSCTLFKISTVMLLKQKNNFFTIMTCIVGCIAVFLSTSLTLSIGLVVGVGLLFLTLDSLRYKVFRLLFVGGVAFASLLVFDYSLRGNYSILNRLIIYLRKPEMLSEFWVFTPPAKWSELLINFNAFLGEPSAMTLGFFNVVFVRLEEFGIIPTLIWYQIIFLPLFRISCLFKKGGVEKTMFMGYFGFVFAALHYSGGEAWGNNYVLFILAAFLMRDSLIQKYQT